MGPSIWQILIVLAIVLLIFGTKKLRNLGGDLGGAIKGFKDAMRDGEKGEENAQIEQRSGTETKPAANPASSKEHQSS